MQWGDQTVSQSVANRHPNVYIVNHTHTHTHTFTHKQSQTPTNTHTHPQVQGNTGIIEGYEKAQRGRIRTFDTRDVARSVIQV